MLIFILPRVPFAAVLQRMVESLDLAVTYDQKWMETTVTLCEIDPGVHLQNTSTCLSPRGFDIF